ncbi:MAG TPA: phage portal protein, partial [Ktedonobacteraceae bacterium]
REPVILHGGVEWQSMSMSPMELDFLGSDTKTDKDIAGIFFNFPVYLLGLDDATFANQAEAKHYLYTDIIFPLWDMFVDDLNSWLTPRYGGYLDYDREDVETIQERIQAAKAQASDRAQAEFTGGTATFAEAREIQGKATLPVKDFMLIQGIPVHVQDLDDYIAALSGKTINPPPPPPLMLPHPAPAPATTVTELPPGKDDASDTSPDDANDAKPLPDDKALPLQRLSPLALPRYITRTKVLDLRTAAQKQAYLKTVEDRRAKWETEATTRLQDYFAGEQKTVLAALERTSDAQGAAGVAEHALTVAGQAGTLKHLLVKLYQDVGTDAGNQVLGELKGQRGAPARKDTADTTQQYLNLFGPNVLIYLLQLSSLKVTQITETTRAEIQSALADGVAAGESMPELAKRIENLYLVEIIPNRSMRIAQTEVVAADNYGSQEAAKQSGLPLRKVFLATNDSHTRPTHAAANGQKVGIDEAFDVGGAKMMYAGDASMGAPAKEIVGCRCTQFYERIEAGSEEEPAKTLPPAQLPERAVSRERYRELLRVRS